MSRKLPKSISPPRTDNFKSSRPNSNRSSVRNTTNNNNFLFERVEQVAYDPSSSTSSRNKQTKTHRIVAEIPYDHRHRSHPQFNRNQTHVSYKTGNPTLTHENRNPNFAQEFGIFGRTVRRSLDNESEDSNQNYASGRAIQDLFDRPDYQKLNFPPIVPPEVCTTSNCRPVEERKPLPLSDCEQKVGGHPILAKYICKGHEDNAYAENYKERDPDYSALRSKTAEVCVNDKCIQVTKQEEIKTTRKENGTQSFPRRKYEDDRKYKNSRHHEFPFKETNSGHLIISPDQIAFETPKVSVLVANPKKTKLNINISKDSNGHIELINEPISKGKNGLRSPTTPTMEHDPEEVRDYLKKIKQGNEVNDGGEETPENFKQHHGSLTLDREYSSTSRGDDKFIDNLHNRIKKAIHPDTYVMIGKKLFPCHAVALQVSSDFFDNIKRPRQAIQKIELPENMVPADIFPTVMEWMLDTPEARQPLVSKESVIPLYIAAVYLAIQELQDQCLEYVRTHVHSGDPQLIKMWDEVKTKLGCQEMMNELATKAASLFPELYTSKKFLKMELDELVMLLSSDEAVINSELDIFDAAIRWLLYDWVNRKIYTPTVMRTVRFGLMTPLNLTQINHCPNTIDAQNSKEYNQVLNNPEVKPLIDAGLAYSILHESYHSNPEELKKWVATTNAVKPRPRLGIKSGNKATVKVLQSRNNENETPPVENEYLTKNEGGKDMLLKDKDEPANRDDKPKPPHKQESVFRYETMYPPTKQEMATKGENIPKDELPRDKFPNQGVTSKQENVVQDDSPKTVLPIPEIIVPNNDDAPKAEYPNNKITPIQENPLKDEIPKTEYSNKPSTNFVSPPEKTQPQPGNTHDTNYELNDSPLFVRPKSAGILSSPQNERNILTADPPVSDNSSPFKTFFPPPNPDKPTFTNKIIDTPTPIQSNSKWNVANSKLVLPKFYSTVKANNEGGSAENASAPENKTGDDTPKTKLRNE